MEKVLHYWNMSYPGNFCIKCGAEDLLEIAIGGGYYDPFTKTWQSEELRREYTNGPCLVTDETYRVWLIRNGKEVPEWVGAAGRI